MSEELVRVRIPRRDGAPDYEGVLALVRDADGLEGVGEAAVIPGRGGAAEACALEVARLDLEGRRRGVPVAELLGGVQRSAVACTWLVEERRPADVARAVEEAAAKGFTAFKLKSANAGGELDVERLGGARWAAGRHARLRIDFNGGLAPERAERVLPTLAHFDLELVEQPLPAGAPLAAWERARDEAPVALFADESLADHDAACTLARAGFGVALKLATVGGPTAALALARAAVGGVTIGSGMETSIGLAAALHVACALDGEPLACGLATLGRLGADLASGLSVGPEVWLPEGPGLGVELDRVALERYRVAE